MKAGLFKPRNPGARSRNGRAPDSLYAALMASPGRNLVVGLAYMAVVMTLAVISYVAAGWSLGDAVYMVVITVYTVGYDEVQPIDTTLLRTITIATVVFGCTGVIFLTGALVQFITLNQINEIFGVRRMGTQMDRLTDHTIICGFGRIGNQLARELQAGRAPFLIVDRAEANAQRARDLGYLVLVADATDEDTLREAGVMRARALATVLPEDATNVFITLSARSLNPGLEIIARGNEPSTESKLLQAGANTVVLPTHIGAERIAELILYPQTALLLRGSPAMRDFDKSLTGLGLRMDVQTAAAGSPAEGLSVHGLEQAAGGAFFVVQINRYDGNPVMRPDPDTLIKAGDGLVLIGRLAGGGALFRPPSHGSLDPSGT